MNSAEIPGLLSHLHRRALFWKSVISIRAMLTGQVFKTFPWSFSSWPKCQTVSANTSRVLPGCFWFTHLHSQSTLIPLQRSSVLSKRSSPPFWRCPPLKRPSSCFRWWVAAPRCVSADPTNTDHHSWIWGRREESEWSGLSWGNDAASSLTTNASPPHAPKQKVCMRTTGKGKPSVAKRTNRAPTLSRSAAYQMGVSHY